MCDRCDLNELKYLTLVFLRHAPVQHRRCVRFFKDYRRRYGCWEDLRTFYTYTTSWGAERPALLIRALSCSENSSLKMY